MHGQHGKGLKGAYRASQEILWESYEAASQGSWPAPCLNLRQAGRYTIYLPQKDGRLSWPERLVIYQYSLPACRRRQATIRVVTGPSIGQQHWVDYTSTARKRRLWRQKYKPSVRCPSLDGPSCSQTWVTTHPSLGASLAGSATAHLRCPCHTPGFLDPCQTLQATRIKLTVYTSPTDSFAASMYTKLFFFCKVPKLMIQELADIHIFY